MKHRTRIYYTEKQKAVMWDRRQKGDSLHAIARLFDRNHSSIAGIFSGTGGNTSCKADTFKYCIIAFWMRGDIKRDRQ